METIKDIVAEMRELAKEVRGYPLENSYELLMGLADRIEKAVTNCNQLKMREAVAETEKSIDKAISILEQIPETCGFAGILEDACDVLFDLKEEFVKPALAAPPRNCDLYTEAQLCEIIIKEAQSELSADTPQVLRDIVDIVAKGVIKGLFAEAKGENND